jgi:uncharacterized lipoprotein
LLPGPVGVMRESAHSTLADCMRETMQAQNEMALLKAHADKEQAQFETEWRELGRVLEQDRRLKERMAGQDKGETGYFSLISLEVIYREYCCH